MLSLCQFRVHTQTHVSFRSGCAHWSPLVGELQDGEVRDEYPGLFGRLARLPLQWRIRLPFG